MKLEVFFDKFELFADAPDAVAKMRELVLQLAVQGKLVDQHPSDEPANKLLERIRKTKDRLIGDRAIRRQDCDPIKEGDVPFSIPELWIWTRLGEIGDWGSGSTPARGNHDLYDGGIAWLKSGELNDNKTLAGSEETVTELALKTCSFRRNQPGDVLLAMYGATIGKVAILSEPAVTNQAVCGCTPFNGVINLYLFNFLLSQRARFHAASEGGAQPNISKVKIIGFPFPLPPLAEQKRIVAKVDELMALCDRLEAQQQEREIRRAALARASLARFADAPTLANLQFIFHQSYDISPADLRMSILTLAVQGKLVPQDPNDEPAESLVAKIRGDLHSQKKGSKANQLQMMENELPHEAPLGWCWSCVQELAQPNESVTYGILKPVWVETGVPTVRVTEMKRGVIDVGALPKCDPQRAAKFSKTTLNAGDLLISKDGTIGKTAFVPPELAGGNITQHMLRFAISKRLDRNFVRLCIDAPPCQAWMVGETKGVALQGVNVGDFRRMPLPIPPLAEQRRIVAKVEQLMALVDELEAHLAASRATAVNLLSALVAELTSRA